MEIVTVGKGIPVTQEEIKRVKRMIDNNVPVDIIAELTGRSKKTIQRICGGWYDKPKEVAARPSDSVPEKVEKDGITWAMESILAKLSSMEVSINRLQEKLDEFEPVETKQKVERKEAHLLYLHCEKCGDNFHTGYVNGSKVTCKCGNKINTDDMCDFEYNCQYCGTRVFGKTNVVTATVMMRHKCGQWNNLVWNREMKRYEG